MSSAAVKRARAISRVAMSPGTPEDGPTSLIELAKLDLQKEKKKMKKGKVWIFLLLLHKVPSLTSTNRGFAQNVGIKGLKYCHLFPFHLTL